MDATSMTWEDFQRKATGSVAVLPVGSVEQHGLHAPLGTDLYIARHFAEAAGQRDDTLLLPAVPVGIAEYHRRFPGSLWVRPETLKAYVGDILHSLAGHGIHRLILVNGHGGNRESLRELARFHRMDNPAMHIVVWTWFDAIEPDIIRMYGRRPPLHADEAETAMLAAISPDVVRQNRLADSAVGAGEVWGVFQCGIMVSQNVEDFSQKPAPLETRQDGC